MSALPPREAIVLRMIIDAAERGEPCPGNMTIVDAINCASLSTPPRVLDNLVKMGLITVERFSRARVVTVVETGKSTLRPTGGEALPRCGVAARRDQLAELVANGATMAEAGRAVGVSPSRVTKMWGEIRRSLGWQAV